MNDKIDAIKAFEIIAELKEKDELLIEAAKQLGLLGQKLADIESYCEKQIQIRDDFKEEFLYDFTKGELRILRNILTKLRS